MGSVVAKNGCHAYQVFKPWPMPMLKKGTAHKEGKKNGDRPKRTS